MQGDRRVVVIGSGPPGATAVRLLAEAGIDVTLLEAGSESAASGLTVRLHGVTVAKKNRPLVPREEGLTRSADPAAKVYEDIAPGGLTNHWSCAVPRFSREDFEDAARAGEEYRWPVGYDDLVPFYDRVEPFLHISGTDSDAPHLPAGKVRHRWHLGRDWKDVARIAGTRGLGVTPLPYAYGSDTTLTLSGTVFNSYVRLVRPVLRTRRIDVRFGARALRLEYSGRTGRVDSVVYEDTRTGTEERVRCSAVIVAASALGSTQILLQSACPEFPEGLGNTEGVLGRYLHDHPLAKLIVDVGAPIAMHPPTYITRQPLAGAVPLYAAACVQWTGVALLARSLLTRHPGRLPWAGFNVFGTMAPTKDNWVALDRKNGSTGLEIHVRHPAESRDARERARDELTGLMEAAGMKPSVRLWIVEPAGESKHYGGTCRMHESPRFGMLNADGRLHAVKNVVVADSAAFTTGPEKNPVLTAMALSARATTRLMSDLAAGNA